MKDKFNLKKFIIENQIDYTERDFQFQSEIYEFIIKISKKYDQSLPNGIEAVIDTVNNLDFDSYFWMKNNKK